VFDLQDVAYPRDLSTPELQKLRQQITDECRK